MRDEGRSEHAKWGPSEYESEGPHKWLKEGDVSSLPDGPLAPADPVTGLPRWAYPPLGFLGFPPDPPPRKGVACRLSTVLSVAAQPFTVKRFHQFSEPDPVVHNVRSIVHRNGLLYAQGLCITGATSLYSRVANVTLQIIFNPAAVMSRYADRPRAPAIPCQVRTPLPVPTHRQTRHSVRRSHADGTAAGS
jgi:hypothetical protein